MEVEGTSVKVILIGDGGTGKTSLVNQFVHRKFSSIYKTTIGVDITPYHVLKKNGDTVRFVLWDMSGQTHFERFRARFYTGTSGALIVYDLTNATSFRNIQNWIKECRDNCRRNIPYVLVGNKSDLLDLKVSQNHSPVVEYPTVITSAKANHNVDNAFFSLFEAVIGGSLEKKQDQPAKTTHISYSSD